MSNNQCLECGYPDTKDGQHFKGIYMSSMPCPHCGYFVGRVTIEEQLQKVLAEKFKTRTGLLDVAKLTVQWLRDLASAKLAGAPAALQIVEALVEDVRRRTFQRPEPSKLPVPEGPWTDHPMKDLELHVRVRMPNDCVMDYEVRVFKLYDDGIGDPYKFEMEMENGSIEYTADIEKSVLLIEGTIKWDGCSHNNFTPNDSNRGYIHGCSRQDLVRLGELYRRLFDIAMERMPGNGEYLS